MIITIFHTLYKTHNSIELAFLIYMTDIMNWRGFRESAKIRIIENYKARYILIWTSKGKNMTFIDKKIEPFVFGRQGLFFSKEDSAKALRQNSYYFFVASAILFVSFIFFTFSKKDLTNFTVLILCFGIFYLIIGYAIRVLKSRIASILALISFGVLVIIRVIEKDIGGIFFFSLIFLAAAIRSVKASFYYHKHSGN